jgi:hypothetical protein
MYINRISKAYPRFIGDLQLVYPDATPDNLPSDWVLVQETPEPEYQEGKSVYEVEPEEVDGVWQQRWTVRDLTEAEKAVLDKHNAEVLEFIAKLEADRLALLEAERLEALQTEESQTPQTTTLE